MRIHLSMAACLVAAACAQPVEPPKPQVDFASLVKGDCYTVDLFDPVEIKAASEDTPPEFAQFLGDWGNGAWNGAWCHDLMVTSVDKNGRVEVFEMHAPFEALGQPATAFKRVGRINEDGELRFAYGTETLTYRMVDGMLVATRSGLHGEMTAVLQNRSEPIEASGEQRSAAKL